MRYALSLSASCLPTQEGVTDAKCPLSLAWPLLVFCCTKRPILLSEFLLVPEQSQGKSLFLASATSSESCPTGMPA